MLRKKNFSYAFFPHRKLVPLAEINRNDDAVSVAATIPEIVPSLKQEKQQEIPISAALSPENKVLSIKPVIDEKVAEKPMTLKEAFKDHNQNQQESFMKSLSQPKFQSIIRPPLQADKKNQEENKGLYQKREDQENPGGFQRRDNNQENRGGNYQNRRDNNQDNRGNFQRRDNGQENRGGFQRRDNNQENRGGNYQNRRDNNQDNRGAYPRQNPREKLEISKPVASEIKEKPAQVQHDTTWKKHLPITCEIDEFFKVIVQNISRTPEGIFLYVTMEKNEDDFAKFLEEVTRAHKHYDCVGKYYKFDEIDIGSLMVVPYDGKFLYRAEVIGKDDEVKELKLRLIDCGNVFGEKDLKTLKIPQDFVYSKEMFAFEVQVDSLDDFVEVGNRLDIKICPSEIGRHVKIQKAEIKKKDPVVDAKKLDAITEQTQKHLNVTKSKIEEKLKAKIFITDIEIVPLPSKPFVAQIVDLSLLTELQLLTIIDHSDDNTAFYSGIQEKVNNYIANLKNDPGFYIPEVNEMVLAKFEGAFYRALCMDVQEGKYEVTLF